MGKKEHPPSCEHDVAMEWWTAQDVSKVAYTECLLEQIGYARDTELRGLGMSNLENVTTVRGRIEVIKRQRGGNSDRPRHWLVDGERVQ
jgi:hypothetical protein